MLRDIAMAFPVQPVAKAMEDSFNPATQGWPMPVSGLLVVLAWSLAAIVVIGFGFRWEPGPTRTTMGLALPHHRWRRWLHDRRTPPH